MPFERSGSSSMARAAGNLLLDEVFKEPLFVYQAVCADRVNSLPSDQSSVFLDQLLNIMVRRILDNTPFAYNEFDSSCLPVPNTTDGREYISTLNSTTLEH